MTEIKTARPVLRIVDGGALPRHAARPASIARPARPIRANRGMAFWLDWAPMALLGLVAAAAAVWQVAAAVIR